MKRLTLPLLAVFFVTVTAFSPSPAVTANPKKTGVAPGCADVQLGISYNVPFFPGPAYVTVDVTWSVSQGNSSKAILLFVTGSSPVVLSVSNEGQQSFYFTVPSGTSFTATAVPFSSPHPEKGKECGRVQLSVDIPT